MRSIWVQTLHDLKIQRKLFSFLFLVLVLLSGLLNVALSSTVQGRTLYSTMSNQLKGADIWLWLTPNGVVAYNSGRLHLNHAVEQGPIHRAMGATLSGPNVDTDIQVLGYTTQQPSFDRVKVTEGQYLSHLDPTGIVVDAGLKDQYQLQIGEKLTLSKGNISRVVTIRGFEVNVSRLPYPHEKPALVIALPSLVRQLSGGTFRDGSLVSVRVNNPANAPQIAYAWQREIPRTWLSSVYDKSMVASSADQLTMLTSVFLILFVVIALIACWLIIGNVVFTFVLGQTRKIGIMKSVGFSARQVLVTYCLENCVVGFIASLIGIAASQPLIGFAAAPLTKAMGMANDVPFRLWLSIFQVTFVVCTVLLASYFPASKASRIVTTEAIRFGAEPPRVRGLGILAKGASAGIPLVWSLAAKDLMVKPLRTLVGFFTVLFSICTISFSLLAVNAIQNYQHNPKVWGQYMDAIVAPSKTLFDGAVVKTIQHTPGIDDVVSTWYQNSEPLGKTIRTFRLISQSASSGTLPYLIQAGNGLKNTDDVIVGKGLLDQTGLHVGDRLHANIAGKPANLHIVGQFFDLNNNGQEAVISLQTLSLYVPHPTVLWIGLSFHDYHQTPVKVQQLQKEFGNKAKVVGQNVALPDEATQIKAVITWFSMVLSGIAVLSLFNTLLRSVLERRNNFGVLKAIGMYPGQIILNVVLTGSSLAVIAIILGIPLGVQLLHVILRLVSNLLGSGDFPVPTPWRTLSLTIGAVLTAAIGVSLVPAVHASRVRPVEVLRGE